MSFLKVKAGDGLLRSFCSHMGNVRHTDFVDMGSSIRHSRQRRRDARCLMFPGDILFKTSRFLGNLCSKRRKHPQRPREHVRWESLQRRFALRFDTSFEISGIPH